MAKSMIIKQEYLTAPRNDCDQEVCLFIADTKNVVVVLEPSYVGADCLVLPNVPIAGVESPSLAAKHLISQLGLSLEVQKIADISYVDGHFRTHIFVAKMEGELPKGSSQVTFAPLVSIENLSARLETLTNNPKENELTWRDWGVSRAVLFHVVCDFLSSNIGKEEPTLNNLKISTKNNVQVRILGQVEVQREDEKINLVGRSAQILSALAVYAPLKVSKSSLKEWFWPEDDSDRALHSAVSRLRDKTCLSPDDELITSGDSYALNLDTVSIDLNMFTNLIEQGKASYSEGQLDESRSKIQEAITLWRGDPSGNGLSESSNLIPKLAVVKNSYLSARLLLGQINLDRGNNEDAMSQAILLCNEDPYLEEAWVTLALSQYRSGQQNQALISIQRARGIFKEEGLSLPKNLLVLEGRIYQEDPSLSLPQKVTYHSGESQGELQMYWGYRPAAHADIREEIQRCEEILVVSGLGLTTILNILTEPAMVRNLCTHNPDITLIISRPDHSVRLDEPGGRMLTSQVQVNVAALEMFHESLQRGRYTGNIQFLTYQESFVPRHFLLQVDHSLFSGAYLSHRKGEHSYLFKLHDKGDDFFKLFMDELDYILEQTEPLTSLTTKS